MRNDSNSVQTVNRRKNEAGAALISALIILALLAAVSMTVLAVVTQEAKIAGSDLETTQTFYASAAGIEKMTNDFSQLFATTTNPTTAQLNTIAASYPPELLNEGFTLTRQTLTAGGTNAQVTIPTGPFNGMVASVTPYVADTTVTKTNTGTQVRLQRTINNYLIPIFQFGMFGNEDLEVHPGPPFAFNGRVHANGNLYVSGTTTFLAKVTTANELVTDLLRNGSTHDDDMAIQVGATRVPLTFGSTTGGPNFSSSSAGSRGYFPGSPNGTINGAWDTDSTAPVDGLPNRFGGQLLTRSTGASLLLLPMQIEGNIVREIIKRRQAGDTPILSAARYHTKAQIRILIDDEGNSAGDASGIPTNQGVYLSTFDPSPLPNTALSATPTANGGGRALWRINNNNTSVATSYNEQTSPASWNMQQQNTVAVQADTVRGVKAPPPVKVITGVSKSGGTSPISITANNHGFVTGDKVFIGGNLSGAPQALGGWTITRTGTNTFTLNGTNTSSFNLSPAYSSGGTVYSFTAIPKSPNGTAIPPGAGITGHVLIEIIDGNGVARDVTREVLSMGMTEGEPNAIVYLQRPLWAAFTQGSRDVSGLTNPALNNDPAYANHLVDILNLTRKGADGEISTTSSQPAMDATYGYLTLIRDDTPSGSQPVRSDMPGGQPTNSTCASSTQPVVCNLLTDWGTSNWNTNRNWNAIVPITVYNVREGRINTSLGGGSVYERGITNVIELNMRNMARWVDGVFDNNLLQGTGATSNFIGSPDGYTVYISDRRGDDINGGRTNGMVDNLDIYGPNGTLDPGEDVQNIGMMVKDTDELPDPIVFSTVAPGYGSDATKRAIAVSAWRNRAADGINHAMFRSAVRIFNGENLHISGAAGQLSSTLGITISSENPVYIWGNYNTTGISSAPPDGVSCLNDNTAGCFYLGNQIPSSLVCDAFFPLSKTFFDAQTALYPDDMSKRQADRGTTVAQETSVRVAIIAGNNKSALSGAPDAGNGASGESRLCGGMHNFPRFLEDWSARWNFVGSLIPLYHSTQALGQYNADSTIYGPPIRNWAFDITFTNPARLPPSTPLFQHIEPTGFKRVL